MSDFDRTYTRAAPQARADMAVDAGLRAFMLGVYNKMALGLVVSGAIAWLFGNVDAFRQLLFVTDPAGRLAGVTPIYFVVAFAPLVLLLGSGFVMKNPTSRGTGMLYWTVVALIGASLASVFLRYTDASIAQTFFVTAASFGALSLFGYTTKKDLTGFGSFLIMGLVGLIIASIVAMFFRSPALVFAINVLGVLIFAGLTAYDTQRLKMTYYQLGGNQNALGVATNFGALSMYLNFINLFQFLLAFMGNRE
ncbi:MAG: Bax inhibitor-1/YccA family protein [Pseudomonadota bacterium]|nr:Bax inhibitor-1/YccA family protein [Pseudomonadota bacterium]